MKILGNGIAVLLLGLATASMASAGDNEQALAAQLYQVAAAGDAKEAAKLIAEGAEVNRSHRPWELTPLLVAVGVDEALTDLLIKAGADVNAREREGVTVLMKAVHGGNAAIVKRLLEAPDLEVDARGPRGNTALTYAVLYGYPEMVEALIEQGADVDAGRADGTTPRSLAEHMHHLALAMPGSEETVAHHHAQAHADDDDTAADLKGGPHAHHRSRAEAVGSYTRVLAVLMDQGATTKGDPGSSFEAPRSVPQGPHHH